MCAGAGLFAAAAAVADMAPHPKIGSCGLQMQWDYIAHARSMEQPSSLTIESWAAKEGTKYIHFSDVCRASVQLPRRRRTIKRDEHGARYFLHQELTHLDCVPTKNASSERCILGRPNSNKTTVASIRRL